MTTRVQNVCGCISTHDWRKDLHPSATEGGHLAHTAAVSPRRYFKHYLNGKTYDAFAYGHKAWPIGKSQQK